ncbi:hypothetical protein HK101_005206 [Irineochytrium annulatum]|nr:hypothetical protein HK101_005206 [Irineochytrium annulatum]
MINPPRAGATVDLPPELWGAIVQLAATSLADLGRLSALSRGIRCLAWSSRASRIRFLRSTGRNDDQAIESLLRQLERVHDLRLFPDLPDIVSVLQHFGPVGCGIGSHDRENCLVLRVCDVVDDDAWVSACLKVLSGKLVTNDLGAAFRKLVNQGRVHLVPVLFDGHDGNPSDVVAAKSYLYPETHESSEVPMDIKLIATAARDPVLVFTLLFQHWGYIAKPRPTGLAIFNAAKEGRRDVASSLAEVTGLRLAGGRARQVAGCIWSKITASELVDLDLIRFLINLGATPTSWHFMDNMDYRHRFLPERIADDPLLMLMSTAATYEPTSDSFSCAWQLVRQERLFRQLVNLNILKKSYLNICLNVCANLDNKTLGVAAGERALELGARVSNTTFANAVSSGNLAFLKMITPHMRDRMKKSNQVSARIGGTVAALDPECCEYVLNLGFPVTATSIAQLVHGGEAFEDDGDALRVLAAMLKAAEKDKATVVTEVTKTSTYSSVIRAPLVSRCEIDVVVFDEMDRMFPQVEMLLNFGFVATSRDFATAREYGFVRTAELIGPRVRNKYFSDIFIKARRNLFDLSNFRKAFAF